MPTATFRSKIDGRIISFEHAEGLTNSQIQGIAKRKLVDDLNADDSFVVDVAKSIGAGGVKAVLNTLAGAQQTVAAAIGSEEENAFVDALFSNAAELRQMADDFDEVIGLDDDFKNSFGGQVFQGLGQMPVQIGASLAGAVGGTIVAGPGAGTIGGALIVGGGTAAFQMQTEAVRDAEQSIGKKYADFNAKEKRQTAASSLGYMTIGGAMEYFAAGKLVPAPLKRQIAGFVRGKNPLPSGTVKQVAKSLKREAAEGFLVEGMTESAQGQLLDILAKASYDEDRSLISMQQLSDRFNEFLIGGIVGGTTTATLGSVQRAATGESLIGKKETKAIPEAELEGKQRFTIEYSTVREPVDGPPVSTKRTQVIVADSMEEANTIAAEFIENEPTADKDNYAVTSTTTVTPMEKAEPVVGATTEQLWSVPEQAYTSADTSINQSKLPSGYKQLRKLGVFKEGQVIIDIGGGRFDNAVDSVREQEGAEVLVYDPFNRDKEHNEAVVRRVADGGADVAVSNNTLNVIEEEANQRRVVQQAYNAIKSGKEAHFTVYEGDRTGTGKITSKGFQHNKKTAEYLPLIESVFGPGNVSAPKGGVITATKREAEPVVGAAKVSREYNLLNSPFVSGYRGDGPEDVSTPDYESFHYVVSEKQQDDLNAAIESGAVDNLANQVAEEARVMMDNPDIASGIGWYGRMRTRLGEIFGEDRDLFTHLLGTTSAQTAVELNFRYSVDLYNRFKAGEFDSKIKKYLELRGRMQAGTLGDLLVRIKAKNTKGEVYTKEMTQKSSDSALLQSAARHYDLLPKQKDGSKYGANSYPALKALSQVWFDDRLGKNRMTPKTPQFAMNLNGESLEATIDVWAARLLRRVIYKGQENARILPSEETAVSNPDFALGQLVFRRAAKKLDMNPDDLQALVWFGEKQIWDNNGWTGAAGALKSSFDEPANVYYPIDGSKRSEEDARIIMDFLAKERLVQRDISFPEAVSESTKKNNRKKYDEYLRRGVISDFLKSRGRGAVYESESVKPDREGGRGRGAAVGAARQETTDPNLPIIAEAVSNLETAAKKLGVSTRVNTSIDRPAQYNYETGAIEYNPDILSQGTKERANAILREEVIHASMGKVLSNRANGKSKRKAFEDFMSSVGKSMTPEQRAAIEEVYGERFDDLSAGAEYTRFMVQAALYGRTTESFMRTGKAFDKVKSLIKQTQAYLSRVLGKDIEQNREFAEVIADTFRLLQSVDPEARPVNQKVVEQAMSIASGQEAMSSANISDPMPDLRPYKKRERERKLRSAKRTARKFLQPASDFFGSIHPEIQRILSGYFTNVDSLQLKYAKRVRSFQMKLSGIRNKSDKLELDRLLSYNPSIEESGTPESLRLIQRREDLLVKYGLFNEFNLNVRPVLDELFQAAKDSGLDINYIEGYFPRRIQDLEGLKNLYGQEVSKDFESYIDSINQQRERNNERPMTQDEIALEFHEYITKKKFVQPSRIPANLKQRQSSLIESKAMQFYYPAEESLAGYIGNIVLATETQKLLGKALNQKTKQSTRDGQNVEVINISDLTGELNAKVAELLQRGEINKEKMESFEYGLVQLFGSQNGSENDMLAMLRTFNYGTLLAEPTSTLSQLYDLSFQVMDAGIFPVLSSLVGRKVTMESLGLDPNQISNEFQLGDSTKSQFLKKSVDLTLTATGFRRMDQLLKETNLTANYKNFRRVARMAKNSSRYKKMRSELEFMVGEDADVAMQLFKDGKHDSQLVREILVRRLLETQPLNRFEMPLAVSAHPNARMLYVMKSFVVKQVSTILRRYVSTIFDSNSSKREKARALGDLAKLFMAFALVGFPTDFLKDLLAGRDVYAGDYLTNSTMRVFGFSRYNLYELRKEGAGTVLKNYFFPVGLDQTFTIGNEIGKVIAGDEITDTKLVPYLPFSDLWYYRYGPGIEKQERVRTRKLKEGILPTLDF